jgi:hypothetical protein
MVLPSRRIELQTEAVPSSRKGVRKSCGREETAAEVFGRFWSLRILADD